MDSIYDRLLERAGPLGIVNYYDFVDTVLYSQDLGYYRKDKNRVGRSKETDFYTAESLGVVFRDLVLNSIRNLLKGKSLGEYTFIEFGAEPGGSLLENCQHPFAETKVFRPREAFKIPEKSIIFSNELLDAQPFAKFVFKNGQWVEIGVQIKRPSFLQEVDLKEFSTRAQKYVHLLPESAPEGYTIDFPVGAEELLEQIISQEWQGLLLFFDYGYNWDSMVYGVPQGSARSYAKHLQHNDLLTDPGDQDITHHICWDRLILHLNKHNFKAAMVDRQETFFMTRALEVIQGIVQKSPEQFNRERLTLQEILHPSHMGSKFQVLHAIRLE